jgi:hypothetical protein
VGSNVARKGLIIQNLSATQDLYVRFGVGATTAAPTFVIQMGGYHVMPRGGPYTGLVTGVWPIAVGLGASVTELS